MGEVLPLGTRPRTIEPLLRHVVGHVLRTTRTDQDRTLADVAAVAGVSVQYLSEIERGRKEPSSEVLAAVAGALGLRLVDLAARIHHDLTARGRLDLTADRHLDLTSGTSGAPVRDVAGDRSGAWGGPVLLAA
ncbi:helix-turn-helix transcriptional regulator [Sanguibacter sp. 25GB23B1]|uniref:helix-turn-helix domain-containing protein n=1 Tax=unclassified Sanguibacter TaxID=2645534 RepID=UPI0032AFDE8C